MVNWGGPVARLAARLTWPVGQPGGDGRGGRGGQPARQPALKMAAGQDKPLNHTMSTHLVSFFGSGCGGVLQEGSQPARTPQPTVNITVNMTVNTRLTYG